MGFQVVQGSPQTIWGRVDATDTLYVGQIVQASSDGLLPVGTASGAVDTTSKTVPFGVVIGTNNYEPVFDSTYKGDKITAVTSQADQLARRFQLTEGKDPKADPAAYVEIALLTPNTILRGPIYNASYGTAPTVQTISSASSDGMITPETWSAADVAAFLADESTITLRSGLNKGMYRIGVNTSQTAPAVTHAFPYDNTTSDTGVQVPIRDIGPAKVQFDDESTFVDIAVSVGTSEYYVIDVVKLDLAGAGGEYVEFKFNADHFCSARA